MIVIILVVSVFCYEIEDSLHYYSSPLISNDVPQSLDARERWGDAILPVRNDMVCLNLEYKIYLFIFNDRGVK